MLRPILNAWAWTATVLLVIVGFFAFFLPTWLVTAPFDRGRYAAGRAFRLLGVTAVKLNPLWKFTVDGIFPRDPRRPYVAVSNHESYADIFLISHFPWEMKWMSKTTIFRIPLMGWMMRLGLDIPIDRGDRSSARSAIAQAKDRLERKTSVMIFPEGTRSRHVDLLPFKDGAFVVAIETQSPILPIAVAGTRHAMAKGSFQFMPARAHARALAPIETAGLTLDDLEALKQRVRRVIDDGRHAVRAELGLPSLEAETAG